MRDFVQRIVFSQVVIVIVGGLIAAVLMWFLAPLIGSHGPLSSDLTRVLAMAIVPLVMGTTAGLTRWRDRRMNARMASEITDAGGAAAGSQEVQALSARLREALDALKRSRFGKASGRRWLYQLPWYVLIGPPGSGKTTALVNSGLNFPLSGKFGRQGIGGVGGTRSCDWWFTDEAVLIDTAGRYTSQDSAPEADQAAWIGFLRLLKKYRRRQPLNGIVVAIGTSELIASSDAERQNHAQRIRQRVAEIYAELGVRLPVYVLFTKADLIAGFVEFFDDLGREGRESVWGLTFDYAEPEPEEGALPQYGAEFDALIGRLNERLLERLQQEADLERRALVFGFPQQVASLKELSELFLQEAFQANAFEQPVLLRGVYFASSTQVGAPFDRVMQVMSSMFGIRPDPASGAVANTRSFFLTRLLREVVFGEAALVGSDPQAERRRRRIAFGVRTVAAVAVLAGGAAFGASFVANRMLVADVEAATVDFTNRAQTLKLERVDDPDLRKVVPLLDHLHDLAGGASGHVPPQALVVSFGLSQAGKLRSQEAVAYRKALGDLLLPRLILRLETQLAQHIDDVDFVQQALKVYLMLGRQGPLDRDLVTRWLTLDWQVVYSGETDVALRMDLDGHLHALLAAPFPSIVLNGNIVRRARDTLQRVPLAQRIYAEVTASPAAKALPEWRASDAAGPSAGAVFTRRSGQPLTAGIRGIYTAEGFWKVYLPGLHAAALQATQQAWVLGSAGGGDDPAANPAGLERDATGLYLQDFAQRWDQLIGDISIVRVGDLQGALRALNVLSSPSSPIRLLVVAAANETRLSSPPSANVPSANAPSTNAASGSAAGGASAGADPDHLRRLLGAPATDPDSPAGIAAAFTDSHFQELHALAAVPPNSAPNAPLPIDDVIADLGQLYRSISDAADQPAPMQGGGAEVGASERIQAGAARLPQPVQGWVLGVTKTSASMSLDGQREKLVALWQSSAGPACQAATANHYPFQPSADQDISLGDFARLFGRGGTLDGFFRDNLRTLVDTSRHPWRWRKLGAATPGLGADPLRDFEIAAAIRDSYFVGATPTLGFTLTPTNLEGDAASVTLTSDGQTVSYDRSATIPVRIQWPGPGGSSGAKVVFAPNKGGTPSEIDATGPWAWFHLLDHGQLRRLDGPEHFSLRFADGERGASFDVQAESAANPLAENPAGQFHCPWPQ
jgi:type VI secretion system protein ImpL